jgi:hypothetical protein
MGVLLGGVLGVLVAALTVGCAGDEELSREQYVSELNAMCEDFSEKEREIGEPQTPADLVGKGPRILDAFEAAIVDKVRELEAPGEIADHADRFSRSLADQQRQVLGELIAAAKDANLAKVRELASRNEALNKETTSITREIGAKACAEE